MKKYRSSITAFHRPNQHLEFCNEPETLILQWNHGREDLGPLKRRYLGTCRHMAPLLHTPPSNQTGLHGWVSLWTMLMPRNSPRLTLW